MDSDDEDVSENDIVDWYKSEVANIWDTATDSAFSDLSSNFSDMFRQIMNDVRQRNQPSQTSNGHSGEVNGHSSVNGVHPLALDEPVTNTVSMSSDQLMAMLQDDEEWLEESTTPDEEDMVLSVQLTDSKNQPEQDPKNVKGVSQETSLLLADSKFWLMQPTTTISSTHNLTLLRFLIFVIMFCCHSLSNHLTTKKSSLTHPNSNKTNESLQQWFHSYSLVC